MKQSDRLKEIEKAFPKYEAWNDDICTEDLLWLIARVKKLTEALEEIEKDQWILLRVDLDKIQTLARNALEDE